MTDDDQNTEEQGGNKGDQSEAVTDELALESRIEFEVTEPND